MSEVKLPTVDELNHLPASQVCLLLMRCLNTSDLTFMYGLLKTETRVDITSVCVDLVESEIFGRDGRTPNSLSTAELREFNSLSDSVLGET